MKRWEDREVRTIEYSNAKRQAYIQFKKKYKGPTNSLNINVKSLNQQILRKVFLQKQQQSKVIQIYTKMKPNFTSTQHLFGQSPIQMTEDMKEACQNIKNTMIQIYGSQIFLKFVLNNEKMNFQNKIIIIKFMEQIRTSAENPFNHKQWKQKI